MNKHVTTIVLGATAVALGVMLKNGVQKVLDKSAPRIASVVR